MTEMSPEISLPGIVASNNDNGSHEKSSISGARTEVDSSENKKQDIRKHVSHVALGSDWAPSRRRDVRGEPSEEA